MIEDHVNAKCIQPEVDLIYRRKLSTSHIMGSQVCCCCQKDLLHVSLLHNEVVADESTKKEHSTDNESDSDVSLQNDEAPTKTYKQWMELVFWTFAGSSQHNDGNLYMTLPELQNFIEIVHLDHDEHGEDSVVTADRVLQCLDKTQSGWLNAQPQLAVHEFVEFFCDEQVNPQCHRIRDIVEEQSNWLLLQNALKIFDVVDVDKVECIAPFDGKR